MIFASDISCHTAQIVCADGQVRNMAFQRGEGLLQHTFIVLLWNSTLNSFSIHPCKYISYNCYYVRCTVIRPLLRQLHCCNPHSDVRKPVILLLRYTGAASLTFSIAFTQSQTEQGQGTKHRFLDHECNEFSGILSVYVGV